MRMKLKFSLALASAALIAAPAFADQKAGTNTPPILISPAPAAPAAANIQPPTAEKKPAAKKKAAVKKTVKAKARPAAPKTAGFTFSVPLKPGAATVAANHVNVRGKPTINSEVLTRLTNGQPVTVIEEITRENTKPNDPTVWAKIAVPSTAHLWVNAQFVDTNKLVTVKKLNLRTGPGENYSVAGTLIKGDVVKDSGAKNGWLEVESGANSYAYVAAAYLKQDIIAEPAVAANAAPPSAITPAPLSTNVVVEATPIAPPSNETPASPVPVAGNELVPVSTPTNNAAATTNAAPKIVEPLPPRIVEHEGIVRRTFSIQAPSTFELVDPQTGRTVNYLYSTAKDLDLKRYKGLRIIVTGEESLDDRWKNTPVLTVQKIQVIE